MAFEAFGHRAPTGHDPVDRFHEQVGSAQLFILVVITVFTFGWDLWVNNFRRLGGSTASNIAFFFIYLLVGIMLYWFINGNLSSWDPKTFWFIVRRFAFVFFVPYILHAIRQPSLTGYASFLPVVGAYLLAMVTSAYLPLIVMYYAGFTHYVLDQASHRWKAAYYLNNLITLFVILLIFVPLFTALASSPQLQRYGVSGEQVPGFSQMFSDSWHFITGTYHKVVSGVQNKVNQTLQPITYTGTVEQNQGAQLGVFITDVNPIKDVFVIDQAKDGTRSIGQDKNVQFFGTVKARTLANDFPLQLSCLYTWQGGKQPVTVPAQPSHLTVPFTGSNGLEQFPFNCRIPMSSLPYADANGLSGQFWVRANFSFDTWGYVTFTFMDRQQMTALLRDGKDPATYLGLPSSMPIAKYTPGPVSLGMATMSQPIGVNTQDPSSNVLPSFGVTLSNAWAGQGNITHIARVILQVPDPMQLDPNNCAGLDFKHVDVYAQAGPTPYGNVTPGYTWYVFDDVGTPGATYLTMTCPLKLKDGKSWSSLLGPDLSSQQYTLVARTTYDYLLQRTAPAQFRVMPK